MINSRLPINGMKMPRPQQIRPRPPLTDDQIKAASYVGSAEHKVKRWWGGLPFGWESGTGKATRPKKLHTTICRKVSSADKEEASSWVRAALEAGQFRYFEGDKTYPKHLWYRDENFQHWFGFAVNQVAGTYKGWPVSESEKSAAFD